MLGQARLHTMQWPLWACGPPAEYDINTGSGATPLYAVVSGPCEPVSLGQKESGMLGQARLHTKQWLCGPVSLLQSMIRIVGQNSHHSGQWLVALVGL